MRAVFAASVITLGLVMPAQAFTCSSPEVTGALTDMEMKDNFAAIEKFGGRDTTITASRVATIDGTCRATVTYSFNDLNGEAHTTNAVMAYKYQPTDDGSGVYVDALDYEQAYTIPPDTMLGILIEQKGKIADAEIAAKNREYFAKNPQYMGDDGSGRRRQ